MTTPNTSIILRTDSYKQSHYLQYPPNTQHVSSYIEARGCDRNWKETVFFGLQAFIKSYLTKPITADDIDLAERVCKMQGIPFNREGWEYILEAHKGYLPLVITAVKEGTVVPLKNALVQVENTDPNCAWLTSFIETALLRAVWYPTTVATLSWQIRNTIRKYMKLTCDTLDKLPFMLNDFGARGVSSAESAELGGLAHLVSFAGTDNMEAILAGMTYYDANEMQAYSVPAAEHSTITSWGRAGEIDAYRNMLTQFGGKYPLIAVVSDSYDIFNACENIWGDELKANVESSGSTLVVRPDSGEVIPTLLKVLDILGEKYGTKYNSKGFRVLPDCIRVIQGDGINEDSIRDICQALLNNFWSLDNLVFGMGGALLQQVNRDTLKFAMKANAIFADGEWRDVYKDPIGGGKTSKRGRQALIVEDGEFKSVRYETVSRRQDHLEVVFVDGHLVRNQSFDDIKANANAK